MTVAPSTSRRTTVASVAASFIGLLRTVRRSKARLLAEAGNDVDSASVMLLHTVALEGSIRASALAASLQADPSTVSRQVAGLVRRGLLERRADQADGRASLLVVTEAGRELIAEHAEGRAAFFDELLSDWSVEELQHFAHQLDRFTAAYERTHTAWMHQRATRDQ